MDESSARKAALEIARNVRADPELLLEAVRRTLPLIHRIEDVPADVLDLLIGVESETDDIPDRDVGRLWEPAALAEQWKLRDEYLTRIGPEVIECFRKLAEHLSHADEPRVSKDHEAV